MGCWISHLIPKDIAGGPLDREDLVSISQDFMEMSIIDAQLLIQNE
jgi:hypothetical protein